MADESKGFWSKAMAGAAIVSALATCAGVVVGQGGLAAMFPPRPLPVIAPVPVDSLPPDPQPPDQTPQEIELANEEIPAPPPEAPPSDEHIIREPIIPVPGLVRAGQYNIRMTTERDMLDSERLFRTGQGALVVRAPPSSGLELKDVVLGSCSNDDVLSFIQVQAVLSQTNIECLRVWRADQGVINIQS